MVPILYRFRIPAFECKAGSKTPAATLKKHRIYRENIASLQQTSFRQSKEREGPWCRRTIGVPEGAAKRRRVSDAGSQDRCRQNGGHGVAATNTARLRTRSPEMRHATAAMEIVTPRSTTANRSAKRTTGDAVPLANPRLRWRRVIAGATDGDSRSFSSGRKIARNALRFLAQNQRKRALRRFYSVDCNQMQSARGILTPAMGN